MTFEILLVVVKATHAAGIIVWSGALLATPGLMAQRPRDSGPALDRLHRMARRLYVNWASPAAFVAIATGAARIFLRETFVAWFSLKMLVVSALLMVHVGTGVVMLKVFAPEGRIRRVSGVALTASGMISVIAILWVVLAKPAIDVDAIAGALFAPGAFEPGALGRGFRAVGLSSLSPSATP